MGKKSSDTPNVVGAAKEEGVQNRETARDVTYADRPDQYNPWGSVEWSQERVRDPATGKMVTKWTQNEGLSDPAQKIFDAQLGMMGGRSDLAANMTGRIQDEMGTAADFEQFGDVVGMDYDPTQIRQQAEDAAYQRSANRLDPRFKSERDALDIRLRNQGLTAGDQAYQAQMQSFGNTKNDAYEQARLAATGQGMQEAGQLWNQSVQGNEVSNALRNQQIEEYLSKRQFSLGEQNALNEGQTLADLQQATGGGQ